MQKFPPLTGSQVALMRAEWRTGHVLDDKNVCATRDDQVVYTVFKDINAAIHFVRGAFEMNNEIEYMIYDKNKVVVKYLTPDMKI